VYFPPTFVKEALRVKWQRFGGNLIAFHLVNAAFEVLRNLGLSFLGHNIVVNHVFKFVEF
jgi:hypothetical protein